MKPSLCIATPSRVSGPMARHEGSFRMQAITSIATIRPVGEPSLSRRLSSFSDAGDQGTQSFTHGQLVTYFSACTWKLQQKRTPNLSSKVYIRKVTGYKRSNCSRIRIRKPLDFLSSRDDRDSQLFQSQTRARQP